MTTKEYPHISLKVAEHTDLCVKVISLRKFFDTDTFKNLSQEEQNLMVAQEKYMTLYAVTLDKQIDLAKSKL